MLKVLAAIVAAMFLGLSINGVQARSLKSIGLIVGPLGNPFYVALAKGIESAARTINPDIRVTVISNQNDLNQDVTGVNTLIAAGVDLIILDAADSRAIEPSVRKAREAGITVVGLDAGAQGAEVNLTTDNAQAGKIVCQYLADTIHHRGNVVVINSVPMVALTERVQGCESALKKYSDIKIISDDQRGDGSRDTGLSVMENLLSRFPRIDGVFAINDQMAVGADLAAEQLHRTGLTIVGVDGSPEAEGALKTDTMFVASASQDPFALAVEAVSIGDDLFHGKKQATETILIPATLLTRDNIAAYRGWNSH
jgi:ribose transport system substrate-binding protein